MIARLKHRLPGARGPFLDRVIAWSGSLLIIAIVAFATYYYFDQEVRSDTGPDLVDREIATYEEAVRVNPSDIAARISLGELYLTARRYDESAEQYRVALQLDGDRADALVGLGRTQIASGDHAGARESFETVVAMSLENVMSADLAETARYYLGEIYLIEKKPAEAVTHLKEAVAIDRTDADAWYLLGAAHLDAGSPDESIAALTQAVLFVPNYTEAYEKLEAAYQAKGATAEAQYARGMVAYAKGEFDNAAEDLEAAIQSAPALASAHAGLGLTRESQGRHEDAVAEYQRAADLEPGNFTAQSGLARLGAIAPPAGPVHEGVTP